MTKNIVPLEEFDARVRKTQIAMKKENVDLLLAFSTKQEPAYVRYFIQITGRALKQRPY